MWMFYILLFILCISTLGEDELNTNETIDNNNPEEAGTLTFVDEETAEEDNNEENIIKNGANEIVTADIISEITGGAERTKAECANYAEKRLIKHIETNISKLSNDIPPVNPGQTGTTMQFLLALESLQKVDLSESKFVVTGEFITKYQVTSLQWNPRDFCDMKNLYLNEEMGNRLWRPKIRSGFLTGKPISFGDGGEYVLNYDGSLYIAPRTVSMYSFYCSFDTTAYPFDHHLCKIDIALYSRMEMVTIIHEDCLLYRFRNQAQYELLTCSSELTAQAKLSQLPEAFITYSVLITRNPLYDVLNVLLPTMILGNSNVVVFLLPAKLAQKTSVTVSLILAFFVHLSFVMRSLAPGHQPYLAWYICVVLFVDCVSAIVCGVLLNLKDLQKAELVNRIALISIVVLELLLDITLLVLFISAPRPNCTADICTFNSQNYSRKTVTRLAIPSNYDYI